MTSPLHGVDDGGCAAMTRDTRFALPRHFVIAAAQRRSHSVIAPC
ncbi:MAG TPA: hypothetical protein PLF19_05510 [Ottowia sp.]|jgi:hypothetical protein|nr:hypothetical protein [Ottowia sp.]HOP89660.1 hypothetical protein [Ottowia sp.]HPU09576.1 hypothetical protein [Ottowia sp.]HRM54856.1 hypothetical protein [Ottowia sp.]HRN07713.1 hypothetical protein [Ottowia sp.]